MTDLPVPYEGLEQQLSDGTEEELFEMGLELLRAASADVQSMRYTIQGTLHRIEARERLAAAYRSHTQTQEEP